MGMTTITLNNNVPMVGQPTKDTQDANSLVDTTEKAVEVQVVDKSPPTSQRNIDSRLDSDKVRIEDEPC